MRADDIRAPDGKVTSVGEERKSPSVLTAQENAEAQNCCGYRMASPQNIKQSN